MKGEGEGPGKGEGEAEGDQTRKVEREGESQGERSEQRAAEHLPAVIWANRLSRAVDPALFAAGTSRQGGGGGRSGSEARSHSREQPPTSEAGGWPPGPSRVGWGPWAASIRLLQRTAGTPVVHTQVTRAPGVAGEMESSLGAQRSEAGGAAPKGTGTGTGTGMVLVKAMAPLSGAKRSREGAELRSDSPEKAELRLKAEEVDACLRELGRDVVRRVDREPATTATAAPHGSGGDIEAMLAARSPASSAPVGIKSEAVHEDSLMPALVSGRPAAARQPQTRDPGSRGLQGTLELPWAPMETVQCHWRGSGASGGSRGEGEAMELTGGCNKSGAPRSREVVAADDGQHPAMAIPVPPHGREDKAVDVNCSTEALGRSRQEACLPAARAHGHNLSQVPGHEGCLGQPPGTTVMSHGVAGLGAEDGEQQLVDDVLKGGRAGVRALVRRMMAMEQELQLAQREREALLVEKEQMRRRLWRLESEAKERSVWVQPQVERLENQVVVLTGRILQLQRRLHQRALEADAGVRPAPP